MEELAFKDETPAMVRAARRNGLDSNPCEACDGEGECEQVVSGASPNDPNAHSYITECPNCDGTGTGRCPGCNQLAAYLVLGDGRCRDCLADAAVELVELVEEMEAHLAVELTDGEMAQLEADQVAA